MSDNTRRIDGKPETDADTRFFDLRESGYKGWVNQDGHATEETRDSDTGTFLGFRRSGRR
jgi:hypothetical protein